MALRRHGTFATAGSDGCFNFWDKDSKQRLKASKPQVHTFAGRAPFLAAATALPQDCAATLPLQRCRRLTAAAAATQCRCIDGPSKPAPISCARFNRDGSMFAYAVSYDWSMGSARHSPAQAKNTLMIKKTVEKDTRPRNK